MVEIDIQQFDFWDEKKITLTVQSLAQPPFLWVLVNLDQSQSDDEDSNCCDNENVTAERLFLVSAALYAGSLIRQ